MVFLVLCLYPLLNIYVLYQDAALDSCTCLDAMASSLGISARYYLFFVPLFTYVLYDLIHHNEIEEYVFIRVRNRKAYALGIVLNAIAAPCLLMIVFLITSGLIFFAAFGGVVQTGETVAASATLSRQLFVHASMQDMTMGCWLLLQSSLYLLSFLVSGTLMAVIDAVASHKIVSPLSILSVHLLMYLLSSLDSMPEEIQNCLPYRRLFLVYAESRSDILLSIGYWLVLIAVLTVLLFFIIKKRDVIHSEEDKTV